MVVVVGMNKNNTMADILKMDVTYLGMNPVGQHLFGNGSPIATDVFSTIQEGVDRFGSRIKIDDRPYRLSVNFKNGYESEHFQPRANADRVERLEYSFGHIKRLLEKAAAGKLAAKPVVQPDTRLPHEVLADRVKAQKAAPVAPKVPDEDVRKRLEESRAALLKPSAVPKAEMAASIAGIAKKREPAQKTTQ